MSCAKKFCLRPRTHGSLYCIFHKQRYDWAEETKEKIRDWREEGTRDKYKEKGLPTAAYEVRNPEDPIYSKLYWSDRDMKFKRGREGLTENGFKWVRDQDHLDLNELVRREDVNQIIQELIDLAADENYPKLFFTLYGLEEKIL